MGDMVVLPAPIKTAFAVIAYSICSGTMLVLNKLAVNHVPISSFVTVIQLSFAVLSISVIFISGAVSRDPMDAAKIRVYCVNTFFFVLGLYANLRALESSNVETVIIFRACSPLAVSLCDWLLLGRELPSCRSSAALGVIAAGAIGYVFADSAFQMDGFAAYSWASLYFVMICCEMTYGKILLSGITSSSMWDPTFYTNLFAIIPMIFLGYIMGDFEKIGELRDDQWPLDGQAITILFVSSVVGTLIGYTSWSCRSLISATSFTLLGVINKFLTVLINILIWDKHATPLGTAFLMFALVGGCFYKQAPARLAPVMETSEEKKVRNKTLIEALPLLKILGEAPLKSFADV